MCLNTNQGKAHATLKRLGSNPEANNEDEFTLESHREENHSVKEQLERIA